MAAALVGMISGIATATTASADMQLGVQDDEGAKFQRAAYFERGATVGATVHRMNVSTARWPAERDAYVAAVAEADARGMTVTVSLQEITATTLPLWRAVLARIGLPHVRASLDDADPLRAPAERRRTGVLLVSSTALGDPSATLAVPWPETAVAAEASSAIGAVEVHCLHVPNAANGWTKARTLQGIRAGLDVAPPGAGVVCGDLNTPRRELETGDVVSFARDSRGRLRPERGPECVKAELGVVPGLCDLGYRDAYRSLYGYGSREPSWTWQRISGHGGGWRLDRLFTSAELEPMACGYPHS